MTQTQRGDILTEVINVADYAAKLRTTLYGGDLEISILVYLFKIKVFLYAAHQWKGRVRERLEPQINVLPEDEHDPEGGELSLLFEPGKTGGQDHYSWMIQRSQPLDEFSLTGEGSDDEELQSSEVNPDQYYFESQDAADDAQIWDAVPDQATFESNPGPFLFENADPHFDSFEQAPQHVSDVFFAADFSAASAQPGPVPYVTSPIVSTALVVRSVQSQSQRSVSRRLDDSGVPLSLKALQVKVQVLNAMLPPHMRAKDLKKKLMHELEDILDAADHQIQVASIVAKTKAATTRLTAPICREVCMRILTLLAKDDKLRALYKESKGSTSHIQLDAGGNPLTSTNPGQGMGLNHKYHLELALAFNNPGNCDNFPFEYLPNAYGAAAHSDGISALWAPKRIENGLFAGLGILEPRIPEGFPPEFFDGSRLNTIFNAGLSEYDNCMTNWHSSGNHGGKPMWMFVTPCKTVVPEEQVRAQLAAHVIQHKPHTSHLFCTGTLAGFFWQKVGFISISHHVRTRCYLETNARQEHSRRNRGSCFRSTVRPIIQSRERRKES